jgi:ABC-2 type transport system ATP-binding protein
MNGDLLVVERVTKRLRARKVLDDVSMTVSAGETCALMGENGAGKSTLLRIVAGVLRPDGGRVSIDGISLTSQRSAALANVGYAPERADIPEHLSGMEWIDLIAAVKRSPRPSEERLETLGVTAFVRQRVASLSLGQQRRVALAAALVGSPRLLVLDEPTNGLDADTLEGLVRFVVARADASEATLVATHDEVFATRIRARVVGIQGGKIT